MIVAQIAFFSLFSYSIAYRLIYALSNAGADPNITNEHGNTPLHEALMRDFVDIGLNVILVKVLSLNHTPLHVFHTLRIGYISYRS